MDQQEPSGASRKRKPSTDLSTADQPLSIPKRIHLSADHSDLDNMNPSATDSTSTASSALVPASPAAPSRLESLPQDIFDEISEWLTGADAKNLCLTSKTLHKAFAHRKWAALYVDYDTLQTDHARKSEIDLLDLIQSDTEFNSGGTTTPEVPRTHIPVVNYIRKMTFWPRHCMTARRSSETEAEAHDRVRNILAIISALPKLQQLYIDSNLLHIWDAIFRPLPDLHQVLKNHRTWESIRFVNVGYHHCNFLDAKQISFLREIFNSHLPNLIGLEIHEEYIYWRPRQRFPDYLQPGPPPLTRSIQLQPTSLRRLHLAVSEIENSPEIEGLIFDLDLLKRISEDFEGLEWLAINPRNAFCVNERHFSTPSAHSRRRQYYEILDTCIGYLKHMTSLKRLALPLFFNVHNMYLELDTAAFANKLLEQLPNLEQVCIFVRWHEHLELDRKLAPNGYRWISLGSPKNVFSCHSGVWPAGLQAASHLEAKSPFD